MATLDDAYVGPLEQVPTDEIPAPDSDLGDWKPANEPPRADA